MWPFLPSAGCRETSRGLSCMLPLFNEAAFLFTDTIMIQNFTTTQIQVNLFATDVLAGLGSTPKRLDSRYFYDDRGSRLFGQIMHLPEYYPSRTEARVLQHHKDTLLALSGDEYWHLIDLGAGDATKTRILITHFCREGLNFEYLPADISPYALQDLETRLQDEYPYLPIRTVCGDYLQALDWVGQHVKGKKLVLLLGSNIGNFSEEGVISFLNHIGRTLQAGDRLLIGFDLKKEGHLIHQAYNDSCGVTEAFNKNLLLRINRELGGKFDPDAFDFHAAYDPASGFVRSYLTSKIKQRVWIEEFNQFIHFEAWEPIHTENSRKFSLQEIETLAEATGFRVEKNLLDEKEWFADSIWQLQQG